MNMDFKTVKNFFNDINPQKLKGLKIAGIITGGILAVLYLTFLVVLHFIDINKFMPMASNEVEKISGFKLSMDNPKISTTLKLGVKVKADSVNLNYKDNTPLMSLKKPEIELNLPTILIGHINLDKIQADEFDVYLVFNKDKKYTVMEYVDNIIKNTAPDEKTAIKNEEAADFNFPIEVRNVNIKARKIALHLKDENVNKTYLTQLNNSILTMKSLEGPLRIKTEGFVGIENTDTHFVNLDIDFKTKLPKISKNTVKPVESTEMQESELNFNPFKTLEDFNLRTDIFADLNIKNIEDFRANGDINIQKFSLKLSDIQLPESFVNLNFKDRTINLDSKAYVSREEYLETKSTVTTGKKTKLDLNLNTDKITLKSLKTLIGAVLDICCIENDIKNKIGRAHV